MIPLKDQEAIRLKFAQELVQQVKIDFFTQRDVGLDVPGRTPCPYCKPVGALLTELAGLGGDLLSLRTHYFDDNSPEVEQFGIDRIPAMVLRGPSNRPVKFFGIPGGTEFPSFLECLVDISRGELLLSAESIQSLQDLAVDVSVKVFVTPTCPYCPGMMRLAYQMALTSEHIKAETIEVNEFPELADRYKVQAVPLTVINDTVAIPGMVGEEQIVAEVVKAAAETKPESPKPIERGKERKSGLYIP